MNRKKKLDPFARRKTAIKNIENRQNTMLRPEPMFVPETIGIEHESPTTYRNKRTMSDSSPTHSKKARSSKTSEKQESPKITRNRQGIRNSLESPHSSKIPVNKNFKLQTRTSDENSSVIENSDDETIKITSSSFIMSTSLDVDTIETADRPGDKENEETRSLNDEPSITLQKEMDVDTIETTDRSGDKENEETRSLNDESSITLQKEMDMDTIETADRPGDIENEETRWLNDESSITLQKEMDVDTIETTDRSGDKENEETRSLNDESSITLQKEMDVDTIEKTDRSGDKENEETRSLNDESSITLQKEMDVDTIEKTDRSGDKENEETRSLNDDSSITLQKKMDVDTIETADRPGDKENEETRTLNDESSITLQKEIEQDTITGRSGHKDKNVTCSLDGDTSTNSKTTNKPEDTERYETNLHDGEASINLQKDLMNLDTTNASDRHEDKENNENDFLDGDDNTIRHDFNLNQESFDLLCGSNLDMNIGLDDLNVQLDGNLSSVLQDVVTPSNKKSSMPIENNEILCSDDAMRSNNIEIKRKKRKARQLFKNSCIDFISDNEDFSPGSSERWSPCESEESETDEPKKKKLKKHKKKPNEQEKQKAITEKVISRLKVPRKNKRKSQRDLKNSGKSYENRAGILKDEKYIKENPCVPGKCTRECYNIPDERRKCIFDYYWALDSQRQRDWIALHSKLTDIKRKKTKLDISRRNKSIEYFINEGEGTRQVCQQFLLKTLDVSQKLLQYTNNHVVDGMARTDQRSFNGVLKYSEDAKKYAREFIDKLPAVSSHYCRRDSQKLYLLQELKNVSNLNRLYAEECKLGSIERISEKMFRQIFTGEYNLSFHVPKKDKCVQCVKSENDTEMTITEREELKIHLEEKKASYNRFKVHQNLQSDDTVVTSFDLQKVLNTPYGESMLLYYSRKYSMYNLTFYESQTQKGFCYMWGESDAKRGSNEVATCITKYLKDVDTREKKNVLLYCDACSGQNKNKVVLTAIHNFLTRSENIQVIQINFLLPGHSYMPVDSMHAVIEREVKRLIVWSPSQWPTFIEAARKKTFPYKVETLEYSDILNWNELSTKAFQGDPIKDFRKIRVVTMKKKNLKTIEIKYSMKDDTEANTVEIFQKPPSKKGKGKGKNKTPRANDSSRHNQEENSYENIHLQPLYTGKQTISQAKYNDLRKLCISGTIPKRYHAEYLSLPTSLITQDKLPETDEDENEDQNE